MVKQKRVGFLSDLFFCLDEFTEPRHFTGTDPVNKKTSEQVRKKFGKMKSL